MGSTPNYEIDYNDERLTQVKTEEKQALTENTTIYNEMRDQAKDFYQSQIDDSKEWADKQQQLQQEQTDFTIEQIEQQKEQANKDYIKEQSSAYVDWQKQSNQYGASAEQMAASGLNNTGYSESSKVSMYNTYQNKMAMAKESHSQAILNYNNKIQEARLQNNSALAEIAINAYIQQTELALQGFQYDNSLLQAQMAQKEAISDRYYNRYQDVLAQMNQENALAEEVRQYNEQMAYKKEQDAQAYAQWQQEYALQQAKLAEEKRQFDLLNSTAISANKTSEAVNKVASTAQSAIDKITSALGGAKSTNSSTSSKTTNPNRTSLASTAANSLSKSYADYGVSSKVADNVLSYAGVNLRDCGNSATTKKKSDYYFDNGYQPRYWDNQKLMKSGTTAQDILGDELKGTGIRGSQNVWMTSNGQDARYCVWDGESQTYIDITDRMNYRTEEPVKKSYAVSPSLAFNFGYGIGNTIKNGITSLFK